MGKINHERRSEKYKKTMRTKRLKMALLMGGPLEEKGCITVEKEEEGFSQHSWYLKGRSCFSQFDW